MSSRLFAVVAGGGTAGHVLPALVVAGALAEGRPPGSVELVGSRRGLDAALVERAGLRATLLPGRGFERSLAPAATARNAAAAADLVRALVRSLLLVVRRRPRVVVALGGYASVAPTLAAWCTRVPVVVVNLDAVPGAANRLLGRLARCCAVAFEGTDLPRATTTGAPVRAEIAAVRRDAAARAEARRALGLPTDATVVAAFGGSLGARHLNEAVIELAGRWRRREAVAVYHVVGARDAERAAARAAAEGLAPAEGGDGLWYRQVPYEERMALLYQAADVVVARAGALTVAELAVTGVPAVLVPLPGAPRDHQRRNAEVLVAAGAALLVPDAECDGARLDAELGPLVDDKAARQTMGKAAAALGRPDAAAAVAAMARSAAERAGRR